MSVLLACTGEELEYDRDRNYLIGTRLPTQKKRSLAVDIGVKLASRSAASLKAGGRPDT
jgi:hypothetical protein